MPRPQKSVLVQNPTLLADLQGLVTKHALGELSNSDASHYCLLGCVLTTYNVSQEPNQGAYISVGTTSVFIWDILCHLRDDYHILARHRISLPSIVYFISRLFTLLYTVGQTVIQTTPLGHCNLAVRLATSTLAASLSASELLLFLHVRAIYATERVIVWFFSILWLIVVANAIVAVVITSGMSDSTTTLCKSFRPLAMGLSMIGVHMTNDTLLFAALVLRILRTSSKDSDDSQLKDNIKTVIFGKYVSRLAKALLQNGQQYFLVSIIIHLAALALYCFDAGNATLGFPSVMLMNLMASRLYRKTKLARFDDHSLSFNLSIPPLKDPSAIEFAVTNTHHDGMANTYLTATSPTISIS